MTPHKLLIAAALVLTAAPVFADTQPDPRKALYSPTRARSGGETGNGGDGSVASQVSAIANRAAQEIRNLCANHPELRVQSPCQDEPSFTRTLSDVAWIPASKVFLCDGGKVVLGDLPETTAALKAYGPCTERDAVNFGEKRDSLGRKVILVSRHRYASRMSDLRQQGTALLQNILHEVLSLNGVDHSDSYTGSEAWMKFISSYSRLSRIHTPSSQGDLVTLTVRSELGVAFDDRIYALLAPKRFAKPVDANTSLYVLNVTRAPLSGFLPDGSQDQNLTVTLDRLSDQGVIQTVATRNFRFNTLRPQGEIPAVTRESVEGWLNSKAIPDGLL